MPEAARRHIRAAPIAADIAVELCRTAKVLAGQQEEVPLLRDAVERQLRSVDKSNAAIDQLALELRALRAAIEANTAAILDGRASLDEHKAELKASREAKK